MCWSRVRWSSAAALLVNEDGVTALALGAALLPIGEFPSLLKTAPMPAEDRQLLFAIIGLTMFGLALLAEPGVAAPRASAGPSVGGRRRT